MRIFGFFLFFLSSFAIASQAYSQDVKPDTDTAYFSLNDIDLNLILSASYGHLENVQLLLQRGANINATTIEGVSALMYASDRGDIDMVRFLLEQGAKPDQKPFSGITALISAVQQNYFEVAEILITHGAKPDLQDSNGATALNHAAAMNNYEIIAMLLYYGADPNKADFRGNTPLITAAYIQATEAIEILLINNADPDIPNKNGFTPLMAAVQEKNIEIVKMLVSNKANVNAENEGGMTPLAFAVKSGNLEIVEFLMSQKADINHKIKTGRNLLELSKEEHQNEMTEFLLSRNAKPNLFPDFRSFKMGTELNFNSTDFMSVFSFGLQDAKYHLSADAGFGFRPVSMRVFYEASPHLKYQFWESRYFFHLGINKKFNLFQIRKNAFTGPEIGIRELFTYGSYEGSNRKPDKTFITVPSIGWQIMNEWLNFGIRYDYMNFNSPGINPGRMIVYADFKIPLIKKRLTYLNIPWLEQ